MTPVKGSIFVRTLVVQVLEITSITIIQANNKSIIKNKIKNIILHWYVC